MHQSFKLVVGATLPAALLAAGVAVAQDRPASQPSTQAATAPTSHPAVATNPAEPQDHGHFSIGAGLRG
jgi:hypothetical protein